MLILGDNYREPTLADLIYLSKNLRECDLKELEIIYGIDPLLALVNSVEQSISCVVAIHNNLPFCIAGCCKSATDDKIGIPWLVATNELYRHRLWLNKDVKQGITEMLKVFDLLYNVVDSNNKITIKWLKSLGFKMDYPIINNNGHSITRFELSKHG